MSENENDENDENENGNEKPRPVESPPDTIPEPGRRRSSQKFHALFGVKICTCPEDCELHGPRTE